MDTKSRPTKGATLVELLVCLSVILILASMTAAVSVKCLKRAHRKAYECNVFNQHRISAFLWDDASPEYLQAWAISQTSHWAMVQITKTGVVVWGFE